MKKLFEVLMARILAAQTEAEWNGICRDVDSGFDQGKLTLNQHELLYKLINRLWVG